MESRSNITNVIAVDARDGNSAINSHVDMEFMLKI
jgi:hypothetical protein